MMTDAKKPDSSNGNQQSKSGNGNNANKTIDHSSGGNKRKTYDTVIVSYEESGGKDGCLIHMKATNHTSNQCHILKKIRSLSLNSLGRTAVISSRLRNANGLETPMVTGERIRLRTVAISMLLWSNSKR
jgi:hypothetical protein